MRSLSVPELRDGDIIVIECAMYGKLTGYRESTGHRDDPVTGKVYRADAHLYADAGCTVPVTHDTLPDLFRGLTSWVLSDGSLVRDWYDVPDTERATAQASWGIQGNRLATQTVISREHGPEPEGVPEKEE